MGKAEQVNARLSEAEASDLASLNYYTAKKGDTLALIAKKLKVSRTDLAEANYLSSKTRVSVGQKLMVPREATVLMAARAGDAPAVISDDKAPAAEKAPSVVQATNTLGDDDAPAATADAARVKVVYSVKRGDTLFSIAQLFKTTVDAIRTWNRIPGDRIAAGQRLTLYR
jgi:membrane-bound lytic murein transglycosylase D